MSLSLSFPTPVVSCKPPAQRASRVLKISRSEMCNAHRMAGCSESLASIVLKHACTSLRLSLAGVRYMQRGTVAATASYSRMTPAEFACINGRQAWANWRTIPQSLSGRLPTDRPLRVIDLCCGTGESTRVLAWWLPRGSSILAIEQDARFADAARRRAYWNRRGNLIHVNVIQRSVLESFRDPYGRCLDGSVDIVHAIGCIGCHFPPEETRDIVAECTRVLVEGGYAFLDAGLSGTPPSLLAAIAAEAGLQCDGEARSWRFDRYVQLALRKTAQS